MEQMIEKRTHDDFYLKEKKTTKPKFLTTYVYNQLRKKKFKSLIDIGIGNGEFLEFLSFKLPNKNYIGTDVHKKLLIYNKKKFSNTKFFYDDIIKKNKKKLKADVVHCRGVINIFDQPKIFLNGIINRCNKKGEIYIIHYFNDYGMDYLVKYRDNNLSKMKNHYEKGWNVFSKLSITNLLKKNKSIKSFKFLKINFPKNINVKQNFKDFSRTWTLDIGKQKYFINGLGFLNKLYLLKIKMK